MYVFSIPLQFDLLTINIYIYIRVDILDASYIILIKLLTIRIL